MSSRPDDGSAPTIPVHGGAYMNVAPVRLSNVGKSGFDGVVGSQLRLSAFRLASRNSSNNRTHRINLDDCAERVLGHSIDRCKEVTCSATDHEIKATELLDCLFDSGLELLWLSNVCLSNNASLLRQF